MMQRRAFLSSLAAGLAARLASAATALPANRNIKWAVSAGLWSSYYPEAPFTDMLDVMRDTGFIGVRLTSFPGILKTYNLTTAQLEKEVSKVLDAYTAEKEERILELRESLARREEYLDSRKTGRDFSDEDHLWVETLGINLSKASEEERDKIRKELRKSFQADIDDTEAYIEDAAERLRQVWELFKTMGPKDIVNDETMFRELKDRFGSPYGFG